MVEIIDLKIISLHYGIYLVPLPYLSPSNIILLYMLLPKPAVMLSERSNTPGL